MHRSAHNDTPSVPDYVVPNSVTRVRKLLSNIRSNNPNLLASIASVQTSTTLRNYFEQTVDTLQSAIRATKITIARSQVAVKPHAMDPATDYENVDQEMMSRAPHYQYVYGTDNKTLWHILHYALKDHPSYTSIRSFARTHNGRAAYLDLALRYLEESRNHMIIEEAEDNLNNVFYTE